MSSRPATKLSQSTKNQVHAPWTTSHHSDPNYWINRRVFPCCDLIYYYYYLGVSVVMVVRCKHLREWCGNYAFFQFLKTTSSMTRPSDVDQCPSEDAQTVRIGSITCWQQIRTVTRVSEWFNPVFQWGDNGVQWFTAVVGGIFCHFVLGFVMVVIGHRGIDWKLTLWGVV